MLIQRFELPGRHFKISIIIIVLKQNADGVSDRKTLLWLLLRKLVSWCFEPSQQHGFISGITERQGKVKR